MTRTLILLTLIILGITACMPKGYHRVNGSYNTIDADADCEAIYQMVQKRWYKHDVYNCYYYDKKLINAILKHEKCFIGKDTSFIKNLLGEKKLGSPSSNYYYSIASYCSEEHIYVSEYGLDFRSRDGIVHSIDFWKNTVLY